MRNNVEVFGGWDWKLISGVQNRKFETPWRRHWTDTAARGELPAPKRDGRKRILSSCDRGEPRESDCALAG